MTNYVPNSEILKKYANVLIKFALNSGEGIRPDEVVLLWVRESAKPILEPLQLAVLEAGGHYLTYYVPEGTDRRNISTPQFLRFASDKQVKFSPEVFYKGLAEQIDHQVEILSDDNPHLLSGIDQQKLMRRAQTILPWKEFREQKENQGRFTWVLALFGTPAMALEANLSLEDYWQQIIQACYLDEPDPIAKWQAINAEIHRVSERLTDLKIDKLHLEARETDLWITLGGNRKWLGGRGRNIPSFEIFTSPDCRYTEGKISFNQPLYAYGSLIEGVQLEFKRGRVVKATASQGQAVIEEMVKVPNADMVGEFSLTDSRMSKITKFMANTLFDENVGGEFGNTHLALGSAYKDAYAVEEVDKLSTSDWENLGFNDSAVHTDIMSTTDRQVTAILMDGSEKVIYEHGQFTI